MSRFVAQSRPHLCDLYRNFKKNVICLWRTHKCVKTSFKIKKKSLRTFITTMNSIKKTGSLVRCLWAFRSSRFAVTGESENKIVFVFCYRLSQKCTYNSKLQRQDNVHFPFQQCFKWVMNIQGSDKFFHNIAENIDSLTTDRGKVILKNDLIV